MTVAKPLAQRRQWGRPAVAISAARSGLPAVVLIAVGLSLTSYQTSLVSWGVVTGIAMLGLVVVTGLSGQISLAQGFFVGFGALGTGYFMRFGIEYWLSVLLICLVSMPVGALVGLPGLRLRSVYGAITTMATAALGYGYLFVQSFAAGGAGSITFTPPHIFGASLRSERTFFIVVVVIFLLCARIVHNIHHSHFGRALQAVRESPNGATSNGIDVTFYRLIAFAVSALFGALSGGLLGPLLGAVSAATFTPFLSITFFALALVGGIESIWGSLLAGLLLYTVPALIEGGTSDSVQQKVQIASAVAMILTVRFTPGGIAAAVGRSTDAMIRRISSRRPSGDLSGSPIMSETVTNVAPLIQEPSSP